MGHFVIIWILKVVFVAILVAIFVVLGIRLGKYVQVKHIHHHEELGYAPQILYETVVVLMICFGVTLGLYLIGVDIGFLLFGISFGIAYACKNTFRNVLSGILILTNEEFKIGDLIEFMYDTHTIYFGRIEEVTLRYAVLRKLDRTRVVIPNYLLTSLPIMTYSSEEVVRLQTKVCLVLGTDIPKAIQTISAAVSDVDFTLEKQATRVRVSHMGTTGIDISVYFYIDPNAGRMRFRAISEVNKAIAKSLKEANITFAYPHTALTTDDITRHDKHMVDTLAYNLML